MRDRPEQRCVQALIAKFAVEAFNKPILLRLAGRDVMPADAGAVRPGQNRIGCQLRAVIADDRLRPAAVLDDGIQLTRHSGAR
jgi:hypothetical protein